ncbi:MAG TPA: HAMP domain-containing sensor histidine kinase [Mycobacteriales bacterium]|nr:HAMP domain-containing sensor histidine kinase [Mycobacteriales bacterium]
MRALPLRVTLVVVVVSLSALGLTVSGLAATRSLHGYLQDRVDDQLQDSLRSPAQLARQLNCDAGVGPPRPQSFGSIYVEVGGASCPLPAGVSPPDLPARPRLDREPFTVGSQSGSVRWRVVAALNVNNDVLVVAVPLDEVQRTVSRLARIELVVGLLVLVLLGAGAFLVVRRSLKPLVEVERAAEAVAAGDLSRRVPAGDPGTEIGSLSLSFNTMVAQVEEAFAERAASEAEARTSEERMRRFVGDASHELRTPLTSIRGFAELYRQGALPSQTDVDRAMNRVESEAARMGLLVEDLLLLARLDQQRPLEHVPVDLLELARDAVQDARAVDPGRAVELEVVAAGAAPVVSGDAARLRQVLGNLVGNALTHTSTPVTVRLSTATGNAVLEVEDKGPGIPVADRPRVFERFFRADTSRTRASGGAGLGLSIVAALVAAHRGTVEVLDTPGGGATFRVTLPLAA